MKIFLALLFTSALSSQVWALACDEFLKAAQLADTADYLPDFQLEQVKEMPDGHLEITNLRHIETGLSCKDGNLDAFGASLIETTEPDLIRWGALISASLSALGGTNTTSVATDAMQQAVAAAERNQIKTGVASGVSERPIGEYTFEYGFIAPDGHSFQIYLAE